jgi:hypothetical protein
MLIISGSRKGPFGAIQIVCRYDAGAPHVPESADSPRAGATPKDATSVNPSHTIHTPVLQCKRILADSRTNRRREVHNLDSRTHRRQMRM